MAPVYIENQLISSRGGCAIARNTPLPSGVPSSSWDMFCDEVDRALEPINKAKSLHRCSLIPCGVLLLLFVFTNLAANQFGFAKVLGGKEGVITYGAGVLYAIIQIFVFYRVYQSGNLAFSKVAHICTQYSDGTVFYAMKGSRSVNAGGRRGRARFDKCFIDVTTADDPMPSAVAFVGTTSPIPAFNPSVAVPTAAFVGTTTGPSLFEELSGGIDNENKV